MSPYNPKSAQNLVTMDTLPEGVKTGVVRIRANTEALEWFSSLSASERGQLVEDLYKQQPKKSGVTPDKIKSSRAKKAKTSAEETSGVTPDKTTPKRSRAKKAKTSAEETSGVTPDKTTPKRSRAKKVVS